VEIQSRNRSRFVVPLLGLSLLFAPLSALLVQHDLEATKTVGLQARAQRHQRSEARTQRETAARCSVKPEKRKTTFEQCEKDERKRDDAFYRPMPRKPNNSK
jgi:hypothetical protein